VGLIKWSEIMKVNKEYFERSAGIGELDDSDEVLAYGLYDLNLLKKLIKKAEKNPKFRDAPYISIVRVKEVNGNRCVPGDKSDMLTISNGTDNYFLMPHEWKEEK
jgi:hypothetical protein